MKRLLISITFFILLISCSRTPRNTDLFNDITCAAPCVLGITPGVTSYKEAKEIIKNTPSLLNCQEPDMLPSLQISCDNFGLHFRGKTVDVIGLRDLNLTLEQLIEKYGAPDKIRVAIFNWPGSSPKLVSALLFQSVRMQVVLPDATGAEYRVEPTALITSVSFLSEEAFTPVFELYEDTWNGYGIYQPNQE